MITLKQENEAYNNFVRLTWRNSSNRNFKYRVFRRKVSNTLGINKNDEGFKPVGIINIHDENDINENISILNIHPNCGDNMEFTDFLGSKRTIKESEILQKWLYEASEEAPGGYGLGRVNVKSLEVSKFNLNPMEHLYSANGEAKYDVICVGFFEEANYTNTSEQFTTQSQKVLEKYINDGYGVLVGHDSLSGLFGAFKNLGPIRSNFGIELGQWDDNAEAGFDYDYKFSFQSNRAKIKRSGPLMVYPWNIGTIDEQFDISPTHTTSQVANGDIWVSFEPQKIIGDEYMNDKVRERGNFYLTTYKSSAMIQIGHKMDIEPIEKKMLANALFYIKQVTKKKRFIDATGIDDERPAVPTIINHYIEPDTFKAVFDFRTDEIGVMLEYYVEGTDLDNGQKEVSNVISAVHTSGLDRFEYNLEQITSDTSERRSDFEWIKTKDKMVITEPLKKGYYSFKIMAVDKNLNRSGIKEMVFFMPGLVVREKSPATTKYPNVQRVNHRYRGPHESRKANDVIAQVKFNIRNLKNIVEDLNKEKDIMFTRPDINCTPILEHKDIIQKQVKKIREDKIKVLQPSR